MQFSSSQFCSSHVKQISIGLRARIFRAVPMKHTKQKTKQPIAQHGGNNVTKTVATTICNGDRHVVRNAHHCALCARRLRRRQIVDGFLGPLGPGANKTLTDLVNEWAAKEKIEAQIDYITSQGTKILLTVSAEAQAKTGHDILVMPTWLPHANAELLEPVNDIMAPILKQNGAVNDTVKYLGQANGKWLGVPSCVGSQIKGPCSRIDLMKKYANIDVQQMYPVGSPPRADNWTMETFLKAAEACYKGGLPFGIGLARPPTASIPRALSSSHSARNSSMPTAISPSRPTKCAKRWNFTRS